jgi:hypothetical protein
VWKIILKNTYGNQEREMKDYCTKMALTNITHFIGWSDRIEREREWLGMWHAWKKAINT